MNKKLKIAKSIFWANLFRGNGENGPTSVVKALKRIPIFKQLSEWELYIMAEFVHERSYKDEEFVFEIGQPGAALFIIERGEVIVEAPLTGSKMTELARLRDGDFLGELALLDQSPRSASARVSGNAKALALFRNDLNRLLSVHPEIAAKVYRELAGIIGERLKATNRLLNKEEAAA